MSEDSLLERGSRLARLGHSSGAERGITGRKRRVDSGSPTRGAEDREGAADGFDAIPEALQSRAETLVRAADTVVDHLDLQLAAPPTRANRDRLGLSVPLRVGEGLGDDVVGSRLRRGVEPGLWQFEHLDRYGRVVGKALYRLGEAEVGEDARVDSARELPQLLDRDLRLLLCLLEQCLGLLRRSHRLLPGCAQVDREHRQRELSAVVEVVLEPPPLPVRSSDQAGPRFDEPPCERLALRDHGGHEHRRERRHADVQLGAEGAARDRMHDERPRVVGGLPEREADRHGDREGAAARAEAERGPDQRGEDDVALRAVAAQGELAEQDHRDDHDGSLEEAPEPGVALDRTPPGERERNDDERSRGVAQPPGAPDARKLAGGDHVTETKRQRPHRRADRGAHEDRGDHAANAGDAVEWALAAYETPQEHGRNDHLEDVSDRLADRRADRELLVLVREQVAQQHARPQGEAAEVEKGDPHANRQPDDRRNCAGELEGVADLRGGVVATGQGADEHDVADSRVLREPRGARALGSYVWRSNSPGHLAEPCQTRRPNAWARGLRRSPIRAICPFIPSGRCSRQRWSRSFALELVTA